jgi:hypothetical protein
LALLAFSLIYLEARNIGRLAQKLISYVPSTIPLFGNFEVSMENFEFKACKLGQVQIEPATSCSGPRQRAPPAPWRPDPLLVGCTPEEAIITPSWHPSGNPPGDALPSAWPSRQRPGRTPPTIVIAPRLPSRPPSPLLPCFEEKLSNTPTTSPAYKNNTLFLP